MKAEQRMIEKEGLVLFEGENHMITFIDSQEKIDNLLRPFIQVSDFFGFDAEWDMRYLFL